LYLGFQALPKKNICILHDGQIFSFSYFTIILLSKNMNFTIPYLNLLTDQDCPKIFKGNHRISLKTANHLNKSRFSSKNPWGGALVTPRKALQGRFKGRKFLDWIR